MDQTFHAIIEVVNRASAPIHKIEADIYGLLAPITAVGAALSALAEETGLIALGESASVAIEKVAVLGREIAALAGPLAIIGGIVSAEGILEASKKSAEFGAKLLEQHERTGVEVPVLARLHYVAQQSDLDPEMFDKAIERLNTNLFKARGGKNKDLDAMLTHFDGKNWRKNIHTAEDALGVISNAMRKTDSAIIRQGIVTTSFGAKIGANLTPMLLRGRDAIKSLGDEFERFNGVWTEERASRAKAAEMDWKRLTAAGQGLAMTVGSAITPSLMRLIEPMTDWIAKNRELIAQRVDRAVKQIGDMLNNVDWRGIGEAVKSIWTAFKGLADLLGAKGMVFLGAGLLFGTIIKSAIEAAFAVGRVAFQFGLVAMRLGAMAAFQILGFFADLVTGINLALPVLGALDLALAANPIGAAVLALAALAGLGLLIYKNWEPISKWFSELWSGIKTELQAAWDFIKPLVDKIAHALDRLTGGGGGTHITAAQAMGVPSGLPQAKANGVWASGFGRRFFEALPGVGDIMALHDAGAKVNGRNAPSKGSVDVNVKFDNLPRGATANARTSGNGLNLNVGKSRQMQ